MPVAIQAPAEMWFFGGERPSGYVTTATLSCDGLTGNPVWSVSPAASLLFSSTTAIQPVITAAQASVKVGDVSITCTLLRQNAAVARATATITIRSPAALVRAGDRRLGNLLFGYESRIGYRIVDQFDQTLPSPVPINEEFTSNQIADFSGMDWRRGLEQGALVHPGYWFDRVQGELLVRLPKPRPVDPKNAGAATPVSHWTGDWRVGSLSVGQGIPLRTGVVWRKSRGFAEHV